MPDGDDPGPAEAPDDAPDDNRPLERLVADAADAGEGAQVTLGELVDDFGSRGFGSLIVLFALIATLPPMGGIPGVPTTMGVLIFLIAAQMALGRNEPWVPGWLAKRGVSREKVRKTRDRARGYLAKVDRLIGPRLEWVTTAVFRRVAAAVICVLALLMPPLELLPFAVALPGAMIALLGLAIVASDGLLMIAGLIGAAAALYLGATQLPTVLGLG